MGSYKEEGAFRTHWLGVFPWVERLDAFLPLSTTVRDIGLLLSLLGGASDLGGGHER